MPNGAWRFCSFHRALRTQWTRLHHRVPSFLSQPLIRSSYPPWREQTRLPWHQVRGAKSKTRVKLKDLPQGMVAGAPPLPLQPEDEGPTYPTVVQQARNNMRRFENCVVLTRVGSFYELYFEQAEKYGPLLNLKVAQKKTSAGNVAMVCCYRLQDSGQTG